ncbi:MAG TPA: hypothetical protein VM581_04760 [Magnetospirillaceae bacterium]|nr:hypothetical protein [Magnetospirillaceae bacterium]
MGIFSKKSDGDTPVVALPPGVINLTKESGGIKLTKDTGDVFSIIARWGRKDYDVYALVEYVDGHVEVVSCFGTTDAPHDFSMRTKDGAVVHVSGDKATSDHGGADLPQEVIRVTLNSNIRTVVPVVYSAKNSGTGSFKRYGVSTYVIAGAHDTVPQSAPQMLRVEAVNASNNDNVYTFVPAAIINGPDGAQLLPLELYSRGGSELRPTVQNGRVSMDSGKENAAKPRPNH